MEIDVKNIVENPDGSANLDIVMDQEALLFFLQYGIRQALLNNLTEEFEEDTK